MVKKVLIIFGTRPEAIKLCPLILELKKHLEKFRTVVCVTAQHRKMLDHVLNVFGVIPDYDLNLMTEDQTLFDTTSRVLTGVGKLIHKEKPDMILVQGDTTTTFAASLAAYYSQIPVGHIEAGLRTGNKYSPFPEEVNRKLTTHIVDIHFAPTEKSKMNLLSEGIKEESIIVTGNTVIDALLWVRERIRTDQNIFDELRSIDFSKKIILVTGHRRENFGEGFINLCDALRHVAENNENVEVVYPVHLNPNVKNPVYDMLSGVKNVKLIKPIDYATFVYLMDKSYFIISDSGGIQEEAPSLKKPVLVTRNTTERPEAIECGAVKLVGTKKERILTEAQKLLTDRKFYTMMCNVQKNPYGNGNACERIAKGLEYFLASH